VLQVASAELLRWAWPGWEQILAITGRDRVRTAGLRPQEIRASVADAWTCSSQTCPPSRRCDGWLRKYWQSLARIHVLINNVGGYWKTRHVTVDGLERTFALNHLAPFCSLTCCWRS
jgi:NAD(P)-dependent dehydrogenase (short-subunit alcohol dehydrogenase family)